MIEEDAAASWAYSLCHFTVTSTSLSKIISSLKWLLNRISYGNYQKKTCRYNNAKQATQVRMQMSLSIPADGRSQP